MTTPDCPIAPLTGNQPEEFRCGLTKREHFAALNYAAIVGKMSFDQGAEEMLIRAGIHTSEFEAFAAMLAVNGADALIAALNKPV